MRSRIFQLRLLLGCSLVLLCFGIALADIEDWPFTSAPMFGDAVRLQSPRYRFRIELVDEDNRYQTDLNPWRAGMATAPYWRGFFGHVYGASDGAKPFAKVTEKDREARITIFLEATFRRAGFENRRGRLVLDTVMRETGRDSPKDRVIETETLGYFAQGQYRALR